MTNTSWHPDQCKPKKPQSWSVVMFWAQPQLNKGPAFKAGRDESKTGQHGRECARPKFMNLCKKNFQWSSIFPVTQLAFYTPNQCWVRRYEGEGPFLSRQQILSALLGCAIHRFPCSSTQIFMPFTVGGMTSYNTLLLSFDISHECIQKLWGPRKIPNTFTVLISLVSKYLLKRVQMKSAHMRHKHYGRNILLIFKFHWNITKQFSPYPCKYFHILVVYDSISIKLSASWD